jgi:predicted DNA-binding transcriptional regulator AlpA
MGMNNPCQTRSILTYLRQVSKILINKVFLQNGAYKMHIQIEDKYISGIIEHFQLVVEKIVVNQFAKLKADLIAIIESPKPSPLITETKGLDLHETEKLKAADLRTALIMGKIPEDAGLLIDGKTLAKLLNVSYRTIYRLQSLKSMPESVKIGNMVRWRLAEIIEWVDNGCPSKCQMPEYKKKRRKY